MAAKWQHLILDIFIFLLWKVIKKKRHSSNLLEIHSSPFSTYLYGLLNVDARVSDRAEQVVEATHLLHQHCVHALVVAGRKAAHCCLQVKVFRQLTEDVSCHFKDHVIWGFGICAWRAGLIRDRAQQSDRGLMRREGRMWGSQSIDSSYFLGKITICCLWLVKLCILF